MLVVPCGFYSLCVVFLAKVSDYHDSDHAVEIKIKILDKKPMNTFIVSGFGLQWKKKLKLAYNPGQKTQQQSRLFIGSTSSWQ